PRLDGAQRLADDLEGARADQRPVLRGAAEADARPDVPGVDPSRERVALARVLPASLQHERRADRPGAENLHRRAGRQDTLASAIDLQVVVLRSGNAAPAERHALFHASPA